MKGPPLQEELYLRKRMRRWRTVSVSRYCVPWSVYRGLMRNFNKKLLKFVVRFNVDVVIHRHDQCTLFHPSTSHKVLT